MSARIANSADYYPTARFIEGPSTLQTGKHVYRFYLDTVDLTRLGSENDHLYLYFQDLTGPALGISTIKVQSISLHAEVPGWKQQKIDYYREQYQWPVIEPIDGLYRGKLDRAVRWSELNCDPGLKRLSLGDAWKKQYFGQKFWDYKFLADSSFSAAEYDASAWVNTSVPEPPTPDQAGGYYWYRRAFKVPPDWKTGRLYLRFDDIAGQSQIFLNGKLVGTQGSTVQDIQWIVKNGSRRGPRGDVKTGITVQNFERLKIPSPFDPRDIPDGKDRLPIPLGSGELRWPLAYDVTDLVQPGANTLAVRIFGNPIRGWWIFRHIEDRSGQHVFGLLGDVKLVEKESPAIASVTRIHPTAVDKATRLATHKLVCTLVPEALQCVSQVEFMVDGQIQVITAPSSGDSVSASFVLPADFEKHTAQVAVIGKNGFSIDQRQIQFHGVVSEIRGKDFYLNGERYLVRGINGDPGIDVNADRTVSREAFREEMFRLANLGINSVRVPFFIDPIRMQDAQDAGIMVLPVAAIGSTDSTIMGFGQCQSPDFQLATDRHREMAINLSECPNVLFWNTGNEMHHTPGYVDRQMLIDYLNQARAGVRQWDLYQRPAVFANLDSVRQGWFFTEGQDIVGFNNYAILKDAAADITEAMKMTPLPLVFTEWGFVGSVKRKSNNAAWEAMMRKKWRLVTQPGSIGGFLYPDHGEMDDDQGRSFVRDLLLPYKAEFADKSLSVTSREVSTMHRVMLTISTSKGETIATHLDQVAPGETISLPAPSVGSDDAVVQLEYATHGGLIHHYHFALAALAAKVVDP